MARPSPATRLPHEILEMIIVHLIYDTHSLLACSLTCYSWYIVTAPHLHHTLISPTNYRWEKTKIPWPKPLPYMYRLGLLPLVKRFQIRKRSYCCIDIFSPKCFNRRTLRYFLALTNVQELGIDYLDISGFMPRIRQYFGHFLPTVRSLSLRAPKGSARQIIYFIALFEHLEDLKLLHDDLNPRLKWEPADDQTLIPSFAPPLRGQLTMTSFKRVRILEDMVVLFGGIRFRHMDLSNVRGTRFLLCACAKTLETLRLYPTDPRGEEPSPNRVQALADNRIAGSSIWDFDLSRNKSLRTLQVTARSIDGALEAGSPDSAASLLTYALSTIKSPVFSEVVVFYRDYDFGFRGPHYTPRWRTPRRMSPNEIAEDASLHGGRFEVLRKMHQVRDFRLVLCADVWDRVGVNSVRMLERAVVAEMAKGGFDNIYSKPMVVYRPRGSRPEISEEGWAKLPLPWASL